MSDASATRGEFASRSTSEGFDRHAVDEETLSAAKADYESTTSLTVLLRDPLEAPLATLVLLLILAVFTWQAAVAALQYHPLVGGLVLAAGYLSYRVARLGWRIENDHVATELALRDLRQGDSGE